ncbi:hypothetical protein AABM38_20425 [Heyndrickxia sp. MSNUG]|uniref:hypothetical protein n=1 Tax=Heyndrickxia sp. MSNUG TaxID=3136677 RepID=UPI003C2BB240
MKKNKIIQSLDPDIDTLKCPKCNAIWRVKGSYEFGLDIWVYELDEEYCPNGCKNFFGFRVIGKKVE